MPSSIIVLNVHLGGRRGMGKGMGRRLVLGRVSRRQPYDSQPFYTQQIATHLIIPCGTIGSSCFPPLDAGNLGWILEKRIYIALLPPSK